MFSSYTKTTSFHKLYLYSLYELQSFIFVRHFVSLKIHLTVFVLLLGVIYFYPGIKNNILCYEDFQYKLERTSANRHMYCCVRKEKFKCRARVNFSFNDRLLFLKSLSHNHPPKYLEEKKKCTSEVVRVIKSFNTHQRVNRRTQSDVNSDVKFIILQSDDLI